MKKSNSSEVITRISHVSRVARTLEVKTAKFSGKFEPMFKPTPTAITVGDRILRNLEFGEKIDAVPDARDLADSNAIDVMSDPRQDLFDVAAVAGTKQTTLDAVSTPYDQPQQQTE